MYISKEFELNEIRYKILGYFRAEVIEKEEGDCEGDIIIPEKVEYDSIFYLVASIGGLAFYNCSNLNLISIPDSVTTIAGYAFSGCKGLKDIYCHLETPLEINSSVFEGVSENCTLHVPFESTEKYKKTDVWKEFKIKAIEQK